MLLANAIAVVYGAGGVGSVVARQFAAEGARVFLASRTAAKVEDLAEKIRAAGGVADAAEVDARDECAVEEHFAAVAERAGRIDVLFNAIGMHDVQGRPLTEMSPEEVARPVSFATRTQFLTARAAARRMLPRRRGVIMTITAGPARRAFPNVGGFDAACAALEALWRTFGAELGPHGVRTVLVGSAGSVPEVARTAALMASDYASAMTAVTANVTCGYIVD